MNQEESLKYWSGRFFEWSVAAAEPSTNAANSAQEIIVRDPSLVEMAETMVDGLMQGGYAPHQVVIVIAHGAYLTIIEMIRQYVPRDD